VEEVGAEHLGERLDQVPLLLEERPFVRVGARLEIADLDLA
jgi:hypothetical protein